MKLGLQNNRKFFANVGKPNREPLRTLEEMADEFGIKTAALRAFLGRRDGPSPVMKTQCKRTVTRNWYSPSEMRKWWAEVKDGK